MGNVFQSFKFKTKKIPQVEGTDGANWEKLPLSNMPPMFDFSIPDSSANAVAQAMSNISESFTGLKNTLENVTQGVQNIACSLGDLVDSLKGAQIFADEFAGQNNNTNIYVRTIGLEPVGTINSQSEFMRQVQSILSDTGNDVGLIPKIVPAEIPLNASIIANALSSADQGSLEAILSGKTFGSGSIGITTGATSELRNLSNENNFRSVSDGGGFTTDGNKKISAADKIQLALVKEELVGSNVQRKTIPVTDLIDVLVKYEVIGINPDQSDDDKSIAIERLIRLTGTSSTRIGGIVLVGKAPSLGSLARKVQQLSVIMEWLRPLAERLAFTALADYSPSKGGVDFDQTNVDLSKLDSQSNVGAKDAQAAKEKAANSGVLDHEMIPLELNDPPPDPNDFNSWRKYKPVQLLPSLAVMGGFADEAGAVQGFNENVDSTIQSSTAAVINATTGNLAGLVSSGKDSVAAFSNKLTGMESSIDSIVNEMNDLNKNMVDGLNFLKGLMNAGPTNLDAHLIGPKLTLQSNASYIEAVDAALNDYADPNRPTFGPAPATSVLENQNQLNAALTGTAPPTESTRIWFGVVMVMIGKDRKALGEQMRTVANLLSMDDEAIDLPPKNKIDFSGLKI